MMAGGVTIPKKMKRLLGSYMAAKAEAAGQLEVENPSPEQVAMFWDVRKRDMHKLDPDDPQRNEPLPMRTYKLASKKRAPFTSVKVGEGGEVTPGKKGRRTVTTAKDTVEHVGKREWAERMHSFLTGQASTQGSEIFESDGPALPGVHIGVGLPEHEKVEIRASVTKALAKLGDSHEVEVTEGRQSTTYRGDAAEITKLALGITAEGEGMSVSAIADIVDVQKKTAKGWKPLGKVTRLKAVRAILSDALAKVRKDMGGEIGAGLVTRAAEALAPPKPAARGMTYRQVLQARARKVSNVQVREWRTKERDRIRRRRNEQQRMAATLPDGKLREHAGDLVDGMSEALRRIKRMSNSEVKLRIAHSQSSAMTDTQRELMTRTMAVSTSPKGSSKVTVTNPKTGSSKEVTVASTRDLTQAMQGLTKSQDTDKLDPGMLRDMLRFPRLSQLVWADDALPTVDRFALEAMLGLH
jgi:hypothetical protein